MPTDHGAQLLQEANGLVLGLASVTALCGASAICGAHGSRRRRRSLARKCAAQFGPTSFKSADREERQVPLLVGVTYLALIPMRTTKEVRDLSGAVQQVIMQGERIGVHRTPRRWVSRDPCERPRCLRVSDRLVVCRHSHRAGPRLRPRHADIAGDARMIAADRNTTKAGAPLTPVQAFVPCTTRGVPFPLGRSHRTTSAQ